MRAINIINGIGGAMFLIGLGGIAESCDGNGSFFISAIVFTVGIGLSMLGYYK